MDGPSAPRPRPSPTSAPNRQTSKNAARNPSNLAVAVPLSRVQPSRRPGSDVTATRYLAIPPTLRPPAPEAPIGFSLRRHVHADNMASSPPAGRQPDLALVVRSQAFRITEVGIADAVPSPRTISPTSRTSNAPREAPSRGWHTSSTNCSMGRSANRRLSWSGHASSCRGHTRCGRW